MSSKYINPYTDFGFKKLFGEEANKDLLIDFLNTLLPEKHRIATLTFQNLESLPDSFAERRAVFDIFCESASGEKFIVEMQKAKQHYFKDRAIFYASYPIRKQGKKGDWNFQLNAVYLVGILDFEYDETEERRKFQRDVSLKDQDGDMFFDKLNFIFLQMPLFKKQEAELQTHRDKWFYFLKNLSDFERIPQILKEPIFERAFETAEFAKMSLEEQDQYEQQLMIYRDNFSVVQTAREEGKIEGKIEAIITLLQTRVTEVPLETTDLLRAVTDIEKLNSLIVTAATCQSIEEFKKKLG
ncbi:MAG: Rpn family recombination-promoting nuclease/putative transposase [Thermoguttaceae bacterium]